MPKLKGESSGVLTEVGEAVSSCTSTSSTIVPYPSPGMVKPVVEPKACISTICDVAVGVKKSG